MFRFHTMYDEYKALVLVIFLAAFGYAGWNYSQGMEIKKITYNYDNPYLLTKGNVIFNGLTATYYTEGSPRTIVEISFKCILNSLSKQPKELMERIPAIQLLTMTFNKDKLESSLLYTGLDGPPSKESINGLNASMANCLIQK